MNKTKERRLIWGILAAAFLLRTLLMLLCEGYSTDVTCFTAWSQNMVTYGAEGFYTGGFFADYPPGYLYWLWGAGYFNQLFGISPSSPLGLYLLGFLPLCCDLVIAWLAYYLSSQAGRPSLGLFAGAVAAFSPAFLFNVAVWKQVDSVITLALLLCFLLLNRKRWYSAAALYGLALLIKPQALILGPVLASGYLLPLVTTKNGRERLQTLLTTTGSAILCLALIFVGALPFQGTQGLLWLPQKYLSTISYYSYGSVNAFNLFAALGGNWINSETGWLLSYGQWGTLFILLATLVMGWLALASVKHQRQNLPLLAGLYGILVFTFSHGMHERYSLPFVVLLLFGWLGCRDRGLLRCFITQSALCFFNVAAAFWCLTTPDEYGSTAWELCMRLGGILQVAVCLWLLVCCFRIFGGGKVTLWHGTLPVGNGRAPTSRLAPWGEKLPWNRRDTLFLLLPTLLCGLLSFWGLGSTQVPATTWHSVNSDQVELEFSPPAELAQLWVYSAIGDGFVELWDGLDTENPAFTADTPFGEMYRWQVFELNLPAQRLTLRGYDANINELVFVDTAGNTVTPAIISENGNTLFDEQLLRPERPSSYTGMYFDEIYHGRTAYEHLQGMEPYENSHPPLGKLLIMLGIRAFGMNPFGWRFVGTLFGVLLLPLLYLTGRLLLKNREYALLGMVLLALDFMRFTQSRIATIDTFAVFFILASYYCMLQWLHHSDDGPLSVQLVPLGLSGLCFGLACGVKWVGVYGGVGLAVLFFSQLWQLRNYRDRVYKLVGAGFAFFVFVPLAVYLLAYLPYYLCPTRPHSLADVWNLQGFMLGYHGQLTETHPFESRWYSWPFIGRPVWYSMGTHLPEGMVSSIALLGNPAVWWSAIAAMAYMVVQVCRRRAGRAELFLLIAFCSQFLPWVFISRSTFLYHYFPSLPFAILALCLLLQRLSAGNRKLRLLPVLLVTLALGLFLWFYPVLCDRPVTVEYAQSLEWFENWDFYWMP